MTDFANALEFSNTRVLVVGASDGIGYGVAKAFKQLGAQVAITGTRSAEQYENDFSDFDYHPLNVVDGDAIDALAAQFERLDVLVNCLGTVLWHKAEFEREGFRQNHGNQSHRSNAPVHGILRSLGRHPGVISSIWILWCLSALR